MKKREQEKSMECFVWPQYLVGPQHIEGYFEVSIYFFDFAMKLR